MRARWLFLATLMGCGSLPVGSGSTLAPADPTPGDETAPDGATSEAPDGATHEACTDPTGALAVAPEADFLARGTLVRGERPECRQARHAGAGAAGSRLAVVLEQWDGGPAAELAIHDVAGRLMSEWQRVEEGDALVFDLPRSGEFFVQARPVDPETASNPYALSLRCIDGCDLEYTRYRPGGEAVVWVAVYGYEGASAPYTLHVRLD